MFIVLITSRASDMAIDNETGFDCPSIYRTGNRVNFAMRSLAVTSGLPSTNPMRK